MGRYITLYHFTDERNLESIKKNGLMCWSLLLNKKIPFIPASDHLSRSLDVKKGLQKYVRLCLSPNHPMAYVAHKDGRIGRYKWLEITYYPLFWNTTLFSNKNATANDAIVNGDKSTALDSDDPQAEILGYMALNTSYIKNL